MKEIALHIRHKFKMNVIRLTYSLQLYYDNNVIPPKYLKANPELIGKTSMEIFDITVKTLTDVGLMVILNNHTSSSMWCCSNDDGDYGGATNILNTNSLRIVKSSHKDIKIILL